ncbi:MAG: polysaccharide deacetylase family protein [Pseudomonadota bacterium]
MTWQSVADELSYWGDTGLTLPVWWRDDDAIALTPALRRLVSLSSAVSVPVHLAVIPAQLTPALIAHVKASPWLIPVTHGWAHTNHAPTREKKSEFPSGRDATHDLDQGVVAMAPLGPPVMFVPPWNRIHRESTAALAARGYRAISTFAPRHAARTEELYQINTHVDPIDWHGTRSALPEAQITAYIVSLLRARRERETDPDEPLGLLTHHLDHDTALWDFCARFWEVMAAGPIRPWTLEDLP